MKVNRFGLSDAAILSAALALGYFLPAPPGRGCISDCVPLIRASLHGPTVVFSVVGTSSSAQARELMVSSEKVFESGS